MKFGVRDIANVVFKAKATQTIGNSTFKRGQPVLYIDTATASSLEQATTTVYAQGGRGNSRLIAWEGEKQLTFTVTDALLSPIGFAVLSGAGLFQKTGEKVHVHMTAAAYVEKNGENYEIDLVDALGDEDEIDDTAPVFVSVTEDDGSITGQLITGMAAVAGDNSKKNKLQVAVSSASEVKEGSTVFVDFYIVKDSANVSELQIAASNFGGYYYVEADTLFRDQATGQDMPAVITFPNVKIQSNFTFSMASTGDPSTFDFTMDAFPGYTMFDRKKKVLCTMQIINDINAATENIASVFPHPTGFAIPESEVDSTTTKGEASGE